MELYTYWRSSAAYRVRIALNYKEIGYSSISVNLIKDGGEQKTTDYGQVNPAHLVPSLQDEDLTLNQSLAIIEYLDEKYPANSLLPADIEAKAHVRAFAQDIACDIHPLNNLRVLAYLTDQLEVSQDKKMQWYHHWLHTGFSAVERRLRQHAGHFCFGNEFSLADVCLVPQVFNALRFKLDMKPYGQIQRIYGHCLELPCVKQAAPNNQPDAE